LPLSHSGVSVVFSILFLRAININVFRLGFLPN